MVDIGNPGRATLAAAGLVLAAAAPAWAGTAERVPAGRHPSPVDASQAPSRIKAAISDDFVTGLVVAPALGTYNAKNTATFALTFSGVVEACPDDWRVGVDVLKSADGDPANDNDYVIDAVPGGIELIRSPPGCPSGQFFQFFQKGVTPFVNLPDAWKPGGLGRLRVVARRRDGSRSVPLEVFDRDQHAPANPTLIVLADSTPDPTHPQGLNPRTPDYLSANKSPPLFAPGDQRQKMATVDYYKNVGTNSDGTGGSIWDALPTVQAFSQRYFNRCSQPNVKAAATYFNDGDLGIGRGMHCVYRACTDELACYVENFGRPDGTAVFNDSGQARLAWARGHPFATVAMVERGRMGPDAANRVFFVVYAGRGPAVGRVDLCDPTKGLLCRAQLDDKGFNTFIPGNCVQCHGINATYDETSPPKLKNAIFLPFDLDSFRYFNSQPGSQLSRKSQEPEFRKLNRMVVEHSSLGEKIPEAKRLVKHTWYGDDLVNGTFNGSRVPDGWSDSVAHEQLYRKFVAVGCRTCHVSFVPPAGGQAPLQFATADDFLPLAAAAKNLVCRADPPRLHFMPAAEQTLRQLWKSDGRAQLFGQVPGPLRGDCGVLPAASP
jgi:hypothetical protein